MRFKYAKHYQRSHAIQPKWWSGNIYPENADAIAELVKAVDAHLLADFGSGKGYQYLADRIHERWGGILPHCYDVGVRQLSQPLTPHVFDGVICTDVMEHIAEDDISEVLNEILFLLRPDKEVFIYFNVFCNPAGKEFLDGLNVHLTVKPPEWWEKTHFARIRDNNPRLKLRVDYEYVCCDSHLDKSKS